MSEISRIQKLYQTIVEYQEDVPEISIFTSRTLLELLIHSYYDNSNLTKPVDSNGYHILSDMVKSLQNQNLISKSIFDIMEDIRKKGNIVAHPTLGEVKKSDSQKIIQNISKVLIWYYETNADFSLSFVYQFYKKANIAKNSIPKKFKASFAHLDFLLSSSIFSNTNKFISSYVELITKYENEKSELFDFIYAKEYWVQSYIEFKEEYNNPNWLENMKRKYKKLKGKRNQPAKDYKEIYEDEYFQFKEKEAKIMK
ncbi:MAG: DUF4145 domain-containing protein, partial [Melioribacteraceae bacterium]|nr:DUF4145 domain-containing protein [Melioribacteraceae bacterium]